MNISVVIPTYNREEFVSRAVESVLEQQESVDEIIIVDDGSSDDTKKSLQKFTNLTYIYQENSGVSNARNRGVKAAKNPWIAFLDSDDVWHPKKILLQKEFHKKNPQVLFSHTAETWIRNSKKVKYPKHLKKPFGKCFLQNLDSCKIAASSVLLHKSIFEKIGYFDESLRVCEDYELWLRICFDYEIGLLQEELITKYAGHEQLSSTIFAIDSHHIEVLKNYLETPYKEEVKEMMKKKCEIILKGAKRHNNQDFLKRYNKLLYSLDI